MGFRRVEIAGGRIYSQAVASARAGNFFPGADRHRVPKKTAEPGQVRLKCFSGLRPIFDGLFCYLGKRSHGSECSSVGEAGLGRKRDSGDAFITAEWIRLIVPIEIARIGANGMIGVLRGLMVGEEAFRILVESAAVGVVPEAGEKARHSIVFLMTGFSALALSVSVNNPQADARAAGGAAFFNSSSSA